MSSGKLSNPIALVSFLGGLTLLIQFDWHFWSTMVFWHADIQRQLPHCRLCCSAGFITTDDANILQTVLGRNGNILLATGFRVMSEIPLDLLKHIINTYSTRLIDHKVCTKGCGKHAFAVIGWCLVQLLTGTSYQMYQSLPRHSHWHQVFQAVWHQWQRSFRICGGGEVGKWLVSHTWHLSRGGAFEGVFPGSTNWRFCSSRFGLELGTCWPWHVFWKGHDRLKMTERPWNNPLPETGSIQFGISWLQYI